MKYEIKEAKKLIETKKDIGKKCKVKSGEHKPLIAPPDFGAGRCTGIKTCRKLPDMHILRCVSHFH